MIDFCAVSILGTKLPAVTKQAGRRLQYKLKPKVQERPSENVQTTQDGREITGDDASRELHIRGETQGCKGDL